MFFYLPLHLIAPYLCRSPSAFASFTFVLNYLQMFSRLSIVYWQRETHVSSKDIQTLFPPAMDRP